MELSKIIESLKKQNTTRDLEAGEYSALIMSVEVRSNEKGTNWIAVACELEDGRKTTIRFFFTEKASTRSFREIQKIVREFKLDFDLNEFESLEYLRDVIAELIGDYVMLKVSVFGEFTNYTFKKQGKY